MLLRHLYHRQLAQASYLIGCQATGEALVVDPNRDIDHYLDLAAREGLRVTAVTETHIHADFVSGARELAERAGARLYLSGAGPEEWQYGYAPDAGATLVRDGDRFMVGNIRIDVWHTPGHTPEHVCFLVTDTANADEPMGMLTGDCLFVGAAGRPDLLETAAGVAGAMQTGANDLYDSLQRITTLPDYLQIWPGHGAGSACGKALGAVPQTTLGYERRFNAALRATDRATFIRDALADLPEPPTYFARMKRVNRDGPGTEPTAPLRELDAATAQARIAASAAIIDLRDPARFAAQPTPTAINLAWGDAFLTWAGWLAPADRDILLVGEPAHAKAAARLLRQIGVERVVGYGAPDAVIPANAAQGATIGRLTPDAAHALIAAGDVVVLDVRNPGEYAEAHVPGSQLIPLSQLPRRLAEVPADRPIVTHCQGGVRSPIAASLLLAAGRQPVYDLIGGMDRWRQDGLPFENESGGV